MIDRLRRGARRIAREYRERVRKRWRTGPPPGLDRDVWARIFREHGHPRIVEMKHQHVSGWKDAGAYRVSLTAADGSCLSLIFKNARVDALDIPAFRELPVRPGPSEFHIYRNRTGALSAVTPAVYYCEEVLAGRHYRFVLEDLGPHSVNPATPDDTIRAATQLAKVHAALEEAVDEEARELILHYGDELFDRLLTYAGRNFDRYVAATGDRNPVRVRELLPDLQTLRRDLDPYSLAPSRPVHGDYNKANIFFGTEDTSTIHVIDWEWAGVGLPHADLASLLKRDDPALEQVALARYASQLPSSAWKQHLHAYEWCQLERGLLDAGFLAAQQVDPAHEMGWIPLYIANALRRAHRAYELLRAKTDTVSRSPSDRADQNAPGPARISNGVPSGSTR